MTGTKGSAKLVLGQETVNDKSTDVLEKGKTDVFEIETTNIGKVWIFFYVLF